MDKTCRSLSPWAAFALVQLGTLCAVSIGEMSAESANRQQRRAAVGELTTRHFKPPGVGTKVPPLRAQRLDGRIVDLAAGERPRTVLFIGRCQPCVAALLDDYNRLHTAGARVAVVTRSTVEDVRQFLAESRLNLPVYLEDASTFKYPEWKSPWRPWVVVIRSGRVVYAQTARDTSQDALSRVARLPRETRAHAGRSDARR